MRFKMPSNEESSIASESRFALFRRFVFSPYLAAVIAMFFWAGSTVLVRYVREEVPPMGLSFWRSLLGFLLLLPFALYPLRQQSHLIRKNWKILLFLAFLLMVGGNAILFLSLQYTIAINAAVINSFEPIIIIVLAWLLFRDPFSRRQGFGVAVSLMGVLVLISTGSLDVLAQMDFNQGDLLVTGAYVSWGLYAVMLRKVPRGLDQRITLLCILGFGTILMLPIYLYEASSVRPTNFTWVTINSVVWLAIFSSVLSILLWNYAISKLGAGRAGLFIHLIPAFTVIMAIFLLGEEFRQFHLTGIALIFIGIYFSSRQPGRQSD